MPRPRRQWIRSPSTTTDNRVVIGTPIWTTTAAADGDAVCSPMNSRAKLPRPSAARRRRSATPGAAPGAATGASTATTSAKRNAAKNSGGTCHCPTTIFDSDVRQPPRQADGDEDEEIARAHGAGLGGSGPGARGDDAGRRPSLSAIPAVNVGRRPFTTLSDYCDIMTQFYLSSIYLKAVNYYQ